MDTLWHLYTSYFEVCKVQLIPYLDWEVALGNVVGLQVSLLRFVIAMFFAPLLSIPISQISSPNGKAHFEYLEIFSCSVHNLLLMGRQCSTFKPSEDQAWIVLII